MENTKENVMVKDTFASMSMLYKCLNIILRKGKYFKKHSLHTENSSLGFIEAVHKWL